jgi:phage-related protein (TIGR01555 family)
MQSTKRQVDKTTIDYRVKELEKLNKKLSLEHKELLDSFTNRYTLHGTDHDYESYTKFEKECTIPDETSLALYSDKGIAARCVDLVVDDAYREWYSIKGDSEGTIEKEFKRLKFRETINHAKKMSRVFGGSIILMGINDGVTKTERPVDITNIKSVDYLKVIDRRYVKADRNSIQSNPQDPNFGNPDTYIINYPEFEKLQNLNIHHSRILKFVGIQLPDYESLIEQDGFGLPIYQRLFKPLARLEKGYKDASDLIGRLFQDILGVKGLTGKIAMTNGKGQSELDARIRYLTMARSAYAMIVTDLDNEKVERISASLAGVSETLYKMEEFLSAEAGPPVYKLFGSQPKGFNASDQGGTQNYYDMIKQLQIDDTPNILKLSEYIGYSKGLQSDLDLCWNSPWQLSETEKSKIRLNDSSAIKNLVDSQVMTAEEGHEFLLKYEFYKGSHLVEDDFDMSDVNITNNNNQEEPEEETENQED